MEWMKWSGSGEDKKRGEKEDIALRKIRPKPEIWASASWGGPDRERWESSGTRWGWAYLHQSHWEQCLLCCQSQPGRRTHSRHPQNSPEWGVASGVQVGCEISTKQKSLYSYTEIYLDLFWSFKTVSPEKGVSQHCTPNSSFLLASCPSSQHRAVEPHRWGRNIRESFIDWICCSTLKHFRSSSTFYEIRHLFTVMTALNPPSYTSTEYEATASRPLV